MREFSEKILASAPIVTISANLTQNFLRELSEDFIALLEAFIAILQALIAILKTVVAILLTFIALVGGFEDMVNGIGAILRASFAIPNLFELVVLGVMNA